MSKGEHFSTPDDLAHFEKIGASTNTTGWMQTFGATHHYKYPQSVGADSVADNINFNQIINVELLVTRTFSRSPSMFSLVSQDRNISQRIVLIHSSLGPRNFILFMVINFDLLFRPLCITQYNSNN